MTIRGRRIGLVIGQLDRGGAERQLATLANELRARGAQPVVFCLSSLSEPWGSFLSASGIPVEIIPRLAPFDPSRVLRLAWRLRSRHLDLAHSFVVDTNVYVVLAAALSRVPAVVTSNLNSDFPRDAVRRRLDRLAFLGGTGIWVNSEHVRRFTSEFFGVPGERITVVRQGVDTERFRPAADRAEARRRLGTAGRMLGTVASLTEKKAPWLFLEVAEALVTEFEDVTVLHVGGGPLREKVEARLVCSPGRGRIRILGPRDDVDQILPALDVFLLSSVYEGLPNVILEAMACGVPVVAPDVGGCRELVRHGRSGFLVPSGERDALLQASRALLADPALGARLGSEARRLAVEDHSLQQMTNCMLALYAAAGLKASS